MAQAVIMPKLGQTVEEASIVKWHVKEGDKIAKGDVLFEIETDKAVLEVESFFDGILIKVLVPVDKPVPVSSTVAWIGEKGERVPEAAPAAPDAGAASEEKKEKPAPSSQRPEASAHKPPPLPPTTQQPDNLPTKPSIQHTVSAPHRRLFISPRAKALAKRSLINPANITGTGPNGRITAGDVKSYLDAHNYNAIRISATARAMAAKEEIDILTVRGSGTGGRILMTDIKRAIAEKPQTLSKRRQVIAARLTQSFTTTPHFYVSVAADMTDLLKFRQELKADGKAYSVTAFILEAVILSLKEFPALNSVTDGTTITWRGSVDLGMAVALDDGLVVPVIRNSEDLSISEIHDLSKELAVKARDGKLLPDEMSGSTFTVSNMGMMDVEQFNAIINPGEAAILAVASTVDKPVVKDGKVVVRSMMNMTLSTDHRIVDGSSGASFINAIKNKLEDIELWKSLT